MASVLNFAGSQASSSVQWLPARFASNAAVRAADGSGTAGFCPSSRPDGILQADLRGRQLKGSRVELPEGFSGHVMRLGEAGASGEDEEDGDASTARAWNCTATFTAVTYWNHETEPSKNDVQRRVLDFLDVARKVHAPVDPALVEAELQRGGSGPKQT